MAFHFVLGTGGDIDVTNVNVTLRNVPIILVYRAPAVDIGICDSTHRSRGHAHHDVVGQRRRARDVKLGIEGGDDFVANDRIAGGYCRWYSHRDST